MTRDSEGLRTGRRGLIQHQHGQRRGQLRGEMRGRRVLEAAHGEQCPRTGEAHDRLEFAATVLHRHRTQDDSEPRRGEVDGDVLDDVRQLGDEHVVTLETRVRERKRGRIHHPGQSAIVEAQRLVPIERRTVRRIDDSEPVRNPGRIGGEQVGEPRTRPVTAGAVGFSKVRGRRLHPILPRTSPQYSGRPASLVSLCK